MAYFKTVFTAKTEVLTEADTPEQAKRAARRQLDPDVDWDDEGTYEITEDQFNG